MGDENISPVARARAWHGLVNHVGALGVHSGLIVRDRGEDIGSVGLGDDSCGEGD